MADHYFLKTALLWVASENEHEAYGRYQGMTNKYCDVIPQCYSGHLGTNTYEDDEQLTPIV